MCYTMLELQFAEKVARGLLANTDTEQQSVTVLYGRWALEAVEARCLHIEQCAVCKAAA